MNKLRVLLVDDEIMIREGFKRLFDWKAHDCYRVEACKYTDIRYNRSII